MKKSKWNVNIKIQIFVRISWMTIILLLVLAIGG